MDRTLEERIDSMLKRDIVTGIVFAVGMWLVLIFTLVTVAGVIDDSSITVALVVACGLLGTFNTLGLLSLIRRYRIERMHVYGEDLHNLDSARAARRARTGVSAS